MHGKYIFQTRKVFYALNFIYQQTEKFLLSKKVDRLMCLTLSKQTYFLHCSQKQGEKPTQFTAKLNFKLNDNCYIRYQVSNETKNERR